MYNELLLVLMGFLAVLMIAMAIMVSSQRRRPKVQPEKEEEKVEKIFVEKGFESPIKEPEEIEEPEDIDYEQVFIEDEPEEPEYEEPPVEIIEEPEATVYPEPEPMREEEPIIEPEPQICVDSEPVNEDSIEIAPIESIILDTEYIEPEYDKVIESPPAEPLFEEEEYPEPEYVDPYTFDVQDVSKPDESVIITPNPTFYDPIPEETKEKPVIEESPRLKEEIIEHTERPVEDILEIELSPLEQEELTPVPEEIEPDIEEEPVPEPVIMPKPAKPRSRSRIRKPVIDESDPDLKIDLGVNTCPHCGSKVPDTIYCIYCGKSLNPNNTVDEKEEEN